MEETLHGTPGIISGLTLYQRLAVPPGVASLFVFKYIERITMLAEVATNNMEAYHALIERLDGIHCERVRNNEKTPRPSVSISYELYMHLESNYNWVFCKHDQFYPNTIRGFECRINRNQIEPFIINEP